MPNSNVRPSTLKLAKMALMLAVVVACGYVAFPILPPPASYLLFELQDIPILIAGLVFGSISGFTIGVVAIILRAFLLPLPGDFFGVIMHIIAIGSFVLITSAIYHKFKTKKWGVASLIIGGLCMTAAIIPANIIVTPLFMPFLTAEDVFAMILPVLLPFNLLKVAINTVVVFLLYKRLSPFLHKW